MNQPLRRRTAVLLAALLSACTATAPEPSATAPPPSASEPEASASAPASATPNESASPSEAASPSFGVPGGFSVMPNPEADALFDDRDDCQNLEDGYRLAYPDAWYTNTEIGSVPPCSWFSPSFYEVDDPAVVPDEIAITFEVVETDRGFFEEPISREEVVVGATQTAVRLEIEVEGVTGYEYFVQLGPSFEEGPNLLARTDTEMGGDYELNKAVLDRIMATIEFVGTIQ